MSQFDKISLALASRPTEIPTNQDDDWLDAGAVFRILRRRFWLVLLVAAAVLSALAIPIMSMRQTYSAQSRLVIRESSAAEMTQPQNSAQGELNLVIEVERLLSRDVSERVIADLELDTRAEFNPALRPPTAMGEAKRVLRNIVRPLGGTPAGSEAETEAETENAVILAYLGHLSIVRTSGSPVLSIAFTSEDPQLAAKVPNALIRTYLQERAEQASLHRESAKAWLDQRISDQIKHVAKADSAAKAFRRESELSSVGYLDIAKQVATLTERRTTIGLDRQDLGAQLNGLTTIIDSERWTDATGIPDQPTLPRDLFVLQNNLEKLKKTFGARHPDVIAAQDRVTEAQGAIRAAVLRQKRDIQSHLAALDREDAVLSERLEDASKTLDASRSAEADLAALERVAQSERAVLDSLEEQRRSLRIEASVPVADVEILLPATPPSSPDGRGRSFYLAVAIFVAGSLGLAAALLREMLDDSVRSADHVRRIAKAVPVGLLPRIAGRKARQIVRIYGQGPAAIFADSIRQTLFVLEQAHGGRLPRSILVTSARGGEGKTTLAAALALEMAKTGQKVLLVDAALRIGQLHCLFGTEPTQGLADYLAAPENPVVPTCIDIAPNIALVERGTPQIDWQMRGDRLRAFIEAANRHGQVVVFDCAPALASAFTPFLGSMVERQLLVVRWGSTRRSMLAAAVQRQLIGSNDEILVAINAVDLRRQALYGFSDAGDAVRTLMEVHGRRT